MENILDNCYIDDDYCENIGNYSKEKQNFIYALSVKGFIVFVALIMISAAYFSRKTPLFNYEKGEYSFYTLSESSSADIVTVSADKAKSVKNDLSNIKGESLSLCFDRVDKGEAINFVRNYVSDKNATLIKKEKGDYGESYYYFCKGISGGVNIGGVRVNLHVAISDDKVIIGSPLIFGSF